MQELQLSPGAWGRLIFRSVTGMGVGLLILLCTRCSPGDRKVPPPPDDPKASLPPGDADKGKLALADGFEALVVVDSVGRARHLAVNDNGDIYVKLRAVTPRGGSVALRDTTGDGKADLVKYFGTYKDPSAYGTGMRIYNGYIYYASTGVVYRSKLVPGQLLPDTVEEPIVIDDAYRANPRGTEHITKSITFDDKGHLYVPFGAPGDVCQAENRTPGAPGMLPCPQLDIHGGVWQFDANKPGQVQGDGKKYATGMRSLVAMAWNFEDGNLFAVQHGRDDFARTWPGLYSPWQSALLPSEEFFRITEGTNGGWPYYYFDQMQDKKVLNPEYGGDGRKADGADTVALPLIGFPGHFSPNDLLFYRGDQFPARYKNGAFIAFHGSTIRAPYPQGGYFVAFVPMKGGKPTGPWEVFADGFAQLDTIVNTSDAKARPMGLSEGPDGSLYVTESVKGKIWRIMFKGDKAAFGEQQLAGMETRKQTATNIKQPDEKKDNLFKDTPGSVAYTQYCASCHLPGGQGDGNRYPPLFGSKWVSGPSKTLIEVVLKGLTGPIEVRGKTYDGVMPAHAFLSDEQVADILTYVRTRMTHGSSAIKADEVRAVRAGLK
ncbi:PQQ-dependent sugar dehydrogenase [Dawidia soli]|nr:c-type cytochrome [Dawidia soli]